MAAVNSRISALARTVLVDVGIAVTIHASPGLKIAGARSR